MTRYSRADWGAAPPRGGPGALDKGRVEGLAFHWPGMATPRRGRAQVAQALRAWQRYHQGTHGWSDIAYQEAWDQDGNVWTLRGFGTQSGANGNTDLNERFGAVLLVLAPGEAPSPAMLETGRRRVATFRKRYPGARRLVGHGQIRPGGTACPGPHVLAALRAGAFEPAAATIEVDNNVTQARHKLGKVLDLFTDAARLLDATPMDRKAAQHGADRCRALRADVEALLERLPRT